MLIGSESAYVHLLKGNYNPSRPELVGVLITVGIFIASMLGILLTIAS